MKEYKGKELMQKVLTSMLAVAAMAGPFNVYAELSIEEQQAARMNYMDSRVINMGDYPLEDVTSAGEEEPDETINNEELLSRLEVKDSITPETSELLGEQIDLSTGTLSFSHTDVSLPGNNDLPVSISRSFKGRQTAFTSTLDMGDWALDIPRVQSNVMGYFGYSGPWGQGVACSGTNDDAWTGAFSKNFMPHEYWNGDTLSIPGKINEKLLYNTNTLPDTQGFARITKSGWRVKCIDSGTWAGQGFEVHSPDGTIYTMDELRLVQMPKLKRNTRYHAFMLASKVEDRFGNTVNYNYDARARLTSITASDGRLIELKYENADPKHQNFVSEVIANDRSWHYGYIGNYALETVTRPDGRNWKFELNALASVKPHSVLDHNDRFDVCERYTGGQYLVRVTHPNGVIGSFDLKQILHGRSNTDRQNAYLSNAGSDMINRCFNSLSVVGKTLSIPNQSTNEVWTYQYSSTEGYYIYDTENQVPVPEPEINETAQLTLELRKPYLLDHNLDPRDHRRTTVNSPDGSKTIYYHNRDYSSIADGQLVLTEVYDTDGTTLLKSTLNEFETDPSKSVALGYTNLHMDNTQPMDRPSLKVNTTIFTFNNGNWTKYNTNYKNFNLYAVPELVIEQQGDTGPSRYTRKTHSHDINLWLLNLPVKTEIGSTTSNYKTVTETTYFDATEAKHLAWQPKVVKSFGQVQKTYTDFHTDGNVKTVEFEAVLKDGNVADDPSGKKQYVTYSDYKRGEPQTITVPQRYSLTGSKFIQKTVDKNGWVTRTQGFSTQGYTGAITDYGYDSMGNLAYIDPQDSSIADTVISWNEDKTVQTTQRCTFDGASGCTANSTLMSTVKTFDGLYRPIETVTTDEVSGVSVYQKSEFNAYNKTTFQSYPYELGEVNGGTFGTHTSYDGLQREKSVAVDGGGSKSTAYLTDNKVQTTDFNGNSTTTTYLAYGEPEQKQAILIESPESVTTTIAIDVWGNTNSITQSGLHKGAAFSQTEYRAYDTVTNLLCKVIRADVGTTVYSYNLNGSIAWQASGVEQGTTDTTTNCGYVASDIDPLKTSFKYDNNGATWEKSFGDGSDTIYSSYDINGDLVNVTAGIISQSYGYNHLRQLTSEILDISDRNKSWQFGYGYDTLGALASTTYPDALIGTVEYAPNGFGKATQAVGPNGAAYATAAVYYPNGSLDTFTYGNGITHKTELNARKMPESIRDHLSGSDRLHLSYTYDDQSNITSIIDSVNSQYSLSSLVYDALGRLISTTGGSGIGSSSMTYDSLGNIITYVNKGASLSYNYDTATNLLTSVTDSVGSVSYNFSGGYDVRGNVTNNGNRQFNYNLANQITSSGSNSYIYDGHNRRVISNDSKGTSYSFYSKKGQLLYRETDNGGTSYIFIGKKLIAKDGYIPSTSDSQMHYKPFGESIETPKDDVGYTGHKFDTDLNLSYMQQRYYDPVIGRFYSNDPVGYTAKNPVMSFNRYMYVNNNPYKYKDPNGEFFFLAIPFAIGAAMGAVETIVMDKVTKPGKDIDWKNVGKGALAGGLTAMAGGVVKGVQTFKKVQKIKKMSGKAQKRLKKAEAEVKKAGGSTTPSSFKELESQAKSFSDAGTAVGLGTVGTGIKAAIESLDQSTGQGGVPDQTQTDKTQS